LSRLDFIKSFGLGLFFSIWFSYALHRSEIATSFPNDFVSLLKGSVLGGAFGLIVGMHHLTKQNHSVKKMESFVVFVTTMYLVCIMQLAYVFLSAGTIKFDIVSSVSLNAGTWSLLGGFVAARFSKDV